MEAAEINIRSLTLFDRSDYGVAGGSAIALGKGAITIAELRGLVPRVAGGVFFWGGVAIDAINAYGFVAGEVVDGQVLLNYENSLVRLNDDLLIGKMYLSVNLSEYKLSDCDNVLTTFGK